MDILKSAKVEQILSPVLKKIIKNNGDGLTAVKPENVPTGNEVNYNEPEILYGSVQINNNCMYSIAGKSNRQISNFIITVHYFLSDETSPERVVEISNDSGDSEIFNTDATVFSKKDSFSKMVEGKGNYIYSGTNNDFLELKIFLFKNEKKAFKISYLGYNSKENFYVFCNAIIDEFGKVKRVNKDGLIKVKEKIFHFDTFKYFNDHSKNNIPQSE